MTKFMYALHGRDNQDCYIDPGKVSSVIQAGEMQCHVVLDGGYVIQNVMTSAAGMTQMIERNIKERLAEMRLPLSYKLGSTGECDSCNSCDCDCEEECAGDTEISDETELTDFVDRDGEPDCL